MSYKNWYRLKCRDDSKQKEKEDQVLVYPL